MDINEIKNITIENLSNSKIENKKQTETTKDLAKEIKIPGDSLEISSSSEAYQKLISITDDILKDIEQIEKKRFADIRENLEKEYYLKPEIISKYADNIIEREIKNITS